MIGRELPDSAHSPQRIDWLGGAAIVAIAFSLRLSAALLLPNLLWPDEIFQSLEQAHRLAFGYGIIPWDFRVGIRSLLLPGTLAGLMSVTDWMVPGSYDYLACVKVVLVVLSVVPVAVVYRWIQREYRALDSELGVGSACPPALVGCFADGSISDLIYLAPKALTEVIAAHLLVPGLYLLRFPDTRLRCITSGLLLGLAVGLRIHLLPAVVIALTYGLWLRAPAVTELPVRRWIIVSCVATFMATGALDGLTHGLPFQTTFSNYWVNVIEGKSQRWGVSPPWQYVLWLAQVWHLGLIVVAAALVGAWRHQRTLLMTALTILVAHSVIGHKEYRFIAPAIYVMLTICCLQGARLLTGLSTRSGLFGRRLITYGLWLAIWLGFSAFAATALRSDRIGNTLGGGPAESQWVKLSGAQRFLVQLSQDETVCGVGLARLPWFLTGGYSHLHRDLPIYPLGDPSRLVQMTAAFNQLLIRGERAQTLGPFRRRACEGHVCLYQRPGHCRRQAGYHINQLLEAADM